MNLSKKLDQIEKRKSIQKLSKSFFILLMEIGIGGFILLSIIS